MTVAERGPGVEYGHLANQATRAFAADEVFARAFVLENFYAAVEQDEDFVALFALVAAGCACRQSFRATGVGYLLK